jgi:hypothetical protein
VGGWRWSSDGGGGREGRREGMGVIVGGGGDERDELATRLCALSYTAANTMLSTNISVLIRHSSTMVYCSR